MVHVLSHVARTNASAADALSPDAVATAMACAMVPPREPQHAAVWTRLVRFFIEKFEYLFGVCLFIFVTRPLGLCAYAHCLALLPFVLLLSCTPLSLFLHRANR